MESTVLLLVLAVGLILAGVIDVREGRIPNWITFPLAGCGVAAHSWAQGWAGFLSSVEGMALGILCLIFFYIQGGMGAGDVKLLGAIGSIVGPHLVVYVFGFAALLGGLYALVMLFVQGGLQYTWERIVLLLNTLRWSKTVMMGQPASPAEPKLRYALVLSLGAVLTQTLAFYGLL